MRCELMGDPAEFVARAGEFLAADPVLNNVMLTSVAVRRDGRVVDTAPATYAVVVDADGAVVGTAMRTPPFGVYVSVLPPAAVAPLAGALRGACPDAAVVQGTAAHAAAFAAAWRGPGAPPAPVTSRQRIYRLDAVRPPWPAPGVRRVAGPADRELLLRWTLEFTAEAATADGPGPDVARLGRAVDVRLAEGRAHLWLAPERPAGAAAGGAADGPAGSADPGAGVPVSYAGTSERVAGVTRLGPVYTPPAYRGRGFASNLIAAASTWALDSGAIACCLYTDLANPTSNEIYRAVGYRPVADVTRFRLAG